MSATDPVCRMDVDEPATFRAMLAGREYFFCSEECRRQFTESPEEYVVISSAPERPPRPL